MGVTKVCFYNNRQDVHMTADTYQITEQNERKLELMVFRDKVIWTSATQTKGRSIDYNSHTLLTINKVDHAARV